MTSNDELLSATRRSALLGVAGIIATAPVLAAVGVANTSPASDMSTLPLHLLRNAAPLEPAKDFLIRGADVVPMLLAEWDTGNSLGNPVAIVWGREAVDKAPAKASRYEQKTYAFPTGSIRVLKFSAVSGGMLHAITSETAIFMLQGSGSVDVAGRNAAIVAGDVVSYPSGVLRGAGDATVIAWTVTGTANNEAAPATVVRRADAKVMESAEWDRDGKRVSARTTAELAAAPPEAVRLSVARYEFPGNSVRVARNFKGGPTSPKSSELDALIFITSGSMTFTQDGRSVEVRAGDAIRELAGSQHFWHRHEDSSFVATSSLPLMPVRKAKP